MCQSKADGGKRCQVTITYRALRRVRAKGDTATERRLLAAREVYGPIVVPGSINVPKQIERTLDDLRQIGNPLIVGGSVRDALYGAEPKDFDIEVYGVTLDDIERHMRRQGYHVDAVGKAFGVLKVKKRGEEDIDISVPRKDSLQEGAIGHRGFTVEQDADLDVIEASSRRDFTMNAIMYDHARGVFIDPHNGISDLQKGILRHVSDAFGEDPLRPLRAFQFAGRFGLQIDPETAEVCRSLRPRFNEVARERVSLEWDKFFTKVKSPSTALNTLRQMGWDDTVPGLSTVDPEASDAVCQSGPVVLGAVMARNMEDADALEFTKIAITGARTAQKAYLLSRTQAPETLDQDSMRKWARDLGRKGLHISDWAEREEAFADKGDQRRESVMQAARQFGVFDARPIDLLGGDDILSLTHKKPGKWVGELLAAATDAQDRGIFSTRDEALAWLRSKVE